MHTTEDKENPLVDHAGVAVAHLIYAINTVSATLTKRKNFIVSLPLESFRSSSLSPKKVPDSAVDADKFEESFYC